MAVAIGSLVILGWILKIGLLMSVIPGWATMKPNTAFCFILSGLSLWLLRGQGTRTAYGRCGHFCASMVVVLSAITLVEHLFHQNFGIDQMLLRDTVTHGTPPGRMSMATSFGLLILGLSLFSLGRQGFFTIAAAQILALVVMTDAVIGCLNYVYGVQNLYSVHLYTTMAAHTTLLFMLLGMGILFARPNRGLAFVITSPHSGGQIARHILPLGITLPFFIGWLQLKGAQTGLYGTTFGLTLFVTSTIILFVVLVWIGAKSLNARERELVEGEHRYRFLADTLPEIIWTAKPDGNVDYLNQRWFDYTGMTLEQSKDWGWKSAVHPDDLRNCLDHWTKSIATGCDYEVEYRFKRASDGVCRWHLGRAFPMRDGGSQIIQWVGTCTDIDDQKRAHSELEKRVTERTAELAGAKERLEEKNIELQSAVESKNRFLANMSHELRTPLNGILGFSEFLTDEVPGPVNPMQKEYLNDILNSGRHLLQLINDVLDLAKVEANKMEVFPEKFSLANAVDGVCAVAKSLAQKKRIKMGVEIAPELDEVVLDQQKFKQILYNLLSNAIKFTNDGGQVNVRVTPQDKEHFKLAVRDTGIGIRAEDISRLFKEFEQLESGTSRRYEGTGLGLALTRKIVELHGGVISVESEVGKGSTFTVILPLSCSSPDLGFSEKAPST